MTQAIASLHTRFIKLLEAREAGMEGVQAAALAGLIGGAVIVFAGLVTGKIQALWANI